jgi:RNase P/RNase MRP subunit POP5
MSVDILLTSLNAGIGDGLYALIDGAQFTEFREIFASNERAIWRSLLPEGAPDDAVTVGPILLQLSDVSHTDMELLLAQSADRNFVSFISSGAEDIGLHLRSLTDVKHDDGTEWVMRYYDPRVIPTWIHVLNDEQRLHVCAPINSWVYRNIHGDFVAIRGLNSKKPASGFPIVLSQSQQDFLMRGSMPYLIRSMLLQDHGNIFPEDSELAQCSSIAKKIDDAAQRGLIELSECNLYCLLSLMLPKNFHNHPLMIEILSNPRTFQSKIQSLTGDEWKSLMLPIYVA